MRQNDCVKYNIIRRSRGRKIKVVVVEEKIDKGLKSLDGSLFNFIQMLKVTKEEKAEGSILKDSSLYNMEPYSNSDIKIDLGIELYDIESSWK